MQDTITPIIIPRYATLHLVAYSCMVYAEDARHHRQHPLADKVFKAMRAYKYEVEKFHPEMNFNLVADLQLEISEQLVEQSEPLFTYDTKYYVMMCIYLNAVNEAASDLIRTKVPFYKHELKILKDLVESSGSLLKKLGWAFKREGLDAWAAILKHNQEEFTL